MAIVAKRTIMSLYSDNNDVYSHQVRIVLAEKGVSAEIIPSRHDELHEDFLNVNPYGTLPTLLDRDLVLYEARIIMEYLDERFPHPPLLPVYPVARAESRKMLHRIENDWYSLLRAVLNNPNQDEAKKELLMSILQLEPVFASKPYFLSDEFSLLDCALIPLLWRLPALGMPIPKEYKAIHAYQERVFNRDAVKASLSETEKQQRAA